MDILKMKLFIMWKILALNEVDDDSVQHNFIWAVAVKVLFCIYKKF